MRACWCCWCSPDDGRSVHFPGVCVLEALTTPVTFMMLGLPARAYLVILALLAANAVTLVVLSFGLLSARAGQAMTVAVAVSAAVVLVSCAVRSISGEWSRRELFLLQCALSKQSQLLSNDASLRRYREVLVANRELYGVTLSNGRSRHGGAELTRRDASAAPAAAAAAAAAPLPQRAYSQQHVARAVTVN
jgi:hypothetical protein